MERNVLFLTAIRRQTWNVLQSNMASTPVPTFRQFTHSTFWHDHHDGTTHFQRASELSQKSPQSLRLFLMMTSVTASKTNWTLLVSVAHVKCV